jgi:hypothetical protein
VSDTYTKLFSSLTESTVWCEPYATRILWVTMLAMADARGKVYGSVPGLARRANITREECDAALASFRAADPDSRTKEHEGRRIEDMDGGWRLLNHGKYAAIRSADERREYWRQHKAAKRAAGKTSDVHDVHQVSTESTEVTPPALTPTPEKKGASSKLKALTLPEWLPDDLWQEWHAYRNSRKGWTSHARELSLRTLSQLRTEGHAPRAVIEQSIENGWTGLFTVKGKSDAKPNHGGAGRRLSAVERVEAAIRDRRSRESNQPDPDFG